MPERRFEAVAFRDRIVGPAIGARLQFRQANSQFFGVRVRRRQLLFELALRRGPFRFPPAAVGSIPLYSRSMLR